MLMSIIAALSTKLEIEEILYSGCEVLSQFFEVPHVTAWMLDENNAVMEINAAHDVPLEGHPSTESANRGLLGCIASSSGDIKLTDNGLLSDFVTGMDPFMDPAIQEDQRFGRLNPQHVENDIQAILIVAQNISRHTRNMIINLLNKSPL